MYKLLIIITIIFLTSCMKTPEVDIKLTFVKSAKIPPLGNLLIIPGGPGLSSLTLKDFDQLSDQYNLYYLDTQGTNGTKFYEQANVGDIVSALAKEINRIGATTIIGHSFGGLIGMSLVGYPNVNGIINISTPMTEVAFEKIVDNYHRNMTPELSAAKEKWLSQKSNTNFLNWLASYGKLYFSNEKRKSLITEDKGSYEYYLKSRGYAFNLDNLKDNLNKFKGNKIFFIGKKDILLDRTQSEIDAKAMGFRYFEIENSAHFLERSGIMEISKKIN